MRMWLLSVWRWRKWVPQISQGYGFSPVWINTWARRWATWRRIKTYIKTHTLKSSGLTFAKLFFSHLDKSGTTRLTFVWLFSRVNAGMGLEVGWPVELSAADVAVVRLRTWRKISRLCNDQNSHIQEVNLIVLYKGSFNLTGVNGLVAGQVALVAEGSLAEVTFVWLVTVHLGHVFFQGIFICELGVTPIAEVYGAFCTKKQQNQCEFNTPLWFCLK